MREEVQEMTSERRGLLVGAGAAVLAGFGLLKSSSARASVFGEENGPLYGILAQARVLVDQARQLKKDYYDKHIKVAVDSARDVNELAGATKEAYDTVKREKERLQFGIGSINEMGKLEVKDYDAKLNALTRMLEALEVFNYKYVQVDKDVSKVAGLVSPAQKEKLTAKKRVWAVITESRSQSIASETKLTEIQKRETASIQKLEKSGASAVDQVHGSNAVRISSLNDKQDEIIRLLAKNNDLLEAILQHQTTQEVHTRYGEKVRGESHAKARVDAMAKGDWSGGGKKT